MLDSISTTVLHVTVLYYYQTRIQIDKAGEGS